MTFEVVNPLAEPCWNRWVLEHEEARIFHSAEWARVLAECYGYSARCGLLKDAGRVVALLPVIEVSSLLTGRRGVSLPFSDECAPLLGEEVRLESLVEPMREFGRQRGWEYLELRGGAESIPGAVRSEEFTMHYLSLDGSEDQQFQKLRSCQRRNIQKARREGVEIHRFQTLEAIDDYYALHCLTRRRQGIPPQPRRFFHLIHENMIAPGHGFVLLARFGGQPVAGGVYFQFGHKALYKFGAWNRAFQHLRANSLLMWEAICHFRRAGVTQLSLGRTAPQQAGLLQFKRGWGAEEVRMPYYRISLRKQVCLKPVDGDEGNGFARRIMRRLPIPVLRFLGVLAYRHVG